MKANVVIGALLATTILAGTANAAIVNPAYYALWGQAGQTEWKNAADQAPDGNVMVVNPNSGPHTEFLQYIADAIAYAHNTANGKDQDVLGYVSTAWGTRSIAAVKTDIDRYKNFYGDTGATRIDGYFFDEVATDPTATASGCDSTCTTVEEYYDELTAYIGNNYVNDQTVANMGTVPPSNWGANYFGQVIIFEGVASAFFSWETPQWVKNLPNSEFTALIYGLVEADVAAAKTRLTNQGVGNRYLTDRSLAENPWGALASYGVK